jgi:hypothetical protein
MPHEWAWKQRFVGVLKPSLSRFAKDVGKIADTVMQTCVKCVVVIRKNKKIPAGGWMDGWMEWRMESDLSVRHAIRNW